MAAMSAATATANTITPPSSSHGNGLNSWDATDNIHDKKNAAKLDQANRGAMAQNHDTAKMYEYGFEPLPPPKKKASIDNISLSKKSWDKTNRDASGKPDLNGDADDVSGGQSENRPPGEQNNADDSKWIHRDKLARIESQELQAAGIILPRSRASSRPRRGRSEEKLNGSIRRTTSTATVDDDGRRPRSRKASSVSPENRVPEERMPDLDASSWDLRRPDEIAMEGDGNYWTSTGEKRGVSKIPVAKASPAPIPGAYIERHAPVARRQSGGPSELESIAYPKPRPRSGSANTLGATPSLQPAKRNVTDTSPRKGSGTSSTTAARKASMQVKSGKPKTRGGKDSTSSITRPTTRSGDLSPPVKRPEGDPPWMVGSYKPDPRLPPEQQLLPTVAKRLQQEQWEREGKFGSIYDKEFRPLTAEGLLKPPETGPSSPPADDRQEPDEWPLKPDTPKSPTSPTVKQSTSYSTMPKVSDKPQTSPLPSPRSPRSPNMLPQQPPQIQTVTRVPDQPSAADMSMGGEKKKTSGGCGCCLVM
ncbi:hypothetical protein CTRI78_v012114 [Colletotrichum trifolii]|uniref:TeaA receptor TeaR n=1 Tax=Colletotrichum trifolii TaxID=5466 RepID=A0A4R8PZL7_COLTR|nr:hypothetical protein CTRI78_v012114 [Colletotrichum trifolii]